MQEWSVKETEPLSCIDNVHLTQQLIQEISSARLENDKLEPNVLERLRNLVTDTVDISDPDLRLSLDLFMACNHASEATYNGVRGSILRRFPSLEILSYHSVKRHVSEITGRRGRLTRIFLHFNRCILLLLSLLFSGSKPSISKQKAEDEEIHFKERRKKRRTNEAPTLSKGRAGPGPTHFSWPLTLALRAGPLSAGPGPGSA